MTTDRAGTYQFRLGFFMEVVMALAVGGAFARDPMSPSMHAIHGFESTSLGKALEFTHNEHAAACGFVLVIGVGTWLEAFRGKPPRTWGPGRWALSAWAAYILLQHALLIIDHVITRIQLQDELGWVGSLPPGLQIIRTGTTPQCALMFLAVWVSALVARTPLAPAGDARERLGRWVVLLVIVTMVSDRVLTTFHDLFFRGGL